MGTAPPGATEPRALYKALAAQSPHHPSGAPGLVLPQEGPLDLETVGSCRREQAVQIHGVGAVCLAHAPQRPQPQDSPARGPSLLRLQGCDTAQVPKA